MCRSPKSGIKIFVIACVCAILCATGARAESLYASLLEQPAHRATLAALARLEESRAWSPKALEPFVTDPEPLVRLRCAEVLGRLDDPRGIPLLARLVDDEDEGVVETAVLALGLIGGSDATGPLGRCLSGKPRNIKIRAIEALGRTGDPKAAALLAPLRADFHAAVRAKTLFALAALEDSTAAQQCIPALHDPDPQVIAAAIYALGRLKHAAAAGEIVQFTGHDDHDVRLRAVEALGRIGSESGVPFIARLLDDRNRMIAIKAAEALVRIGTEKSAEPLLPLLESPDAYLKTLALDGIAASRKNKYFQKVLPLLGDGSTMVRRAAMKAAASTDPKRAREYLLKVTGGGSGTETMTALEWLGYVSDRNDLPLLVGVLESGGDHLAREGAAAGLGRWREPGHLTDAIQCGGRTISPIGALLEAADGEDWVVATISVESLPKTAPGTVIPDLLRIYRAHDDRVDSDRRLAIIEAIDDLGEAGRIAEEQKTEIVSFLKDACTAADARIGHAAVRVAERFGADLEPQPNGVWKRGEPPWAEPFLPLGEKTIIITTSRGEIEVRLFGDDAPTVVGAILHLAREGFYNGFTFHRVVPGFVIQGGCPRGDGWGDAGYFLRSQFNLHRYGRGTVGVAHAGADTPGSQFFITHTPQPHLDGRYTVIGTVVRGMEVVDTIETDDTFSVKVVE
ncbi:MAG TPA: HEAT repeat domain-containing protein [Patescibacteria group bacterium]|nr:HEAT repeat domain-containing protein [Patescibacteria group bacterium]